MLHLFTQHFACGSIHGRRCIFVFNEVTQRTEIFIPYWAINRDRFFRRTQYTIHFL